MGDVPQPQVETHGGEPGLPVYDAAGVDLTLIRWMLSLTPRERLKILDGYMSFARRVEEMRKRGDR